MIFCEAFITLVMTTQIFTVFYDFFTVQIFNRSPIIQTFRASPDQLEVALKAGYHEAMQRLQRQRDLDLLIAILPENNGSLYGMNYPQHKRLK